MKALFIKLSPLFIIFLLMAYQFANTDLHAQEKFYGIYSNMQSSEGEFSGIEFFIVPSNEGDFLIFQQAEGWPQKPLILEVRIGGTKISGNNLIKFTHPDMGPFEGRIEEDSLIGEFTQMKYEIRLTKGKSIWQP